MSHPVRSNGELAKTAATVYQAISPGYRELDMSQLLATLVDAESDRGSCTGKNSEVKYCMLRGQAQSQGKPKSMSFSEEGHILESWIQAGSIDFVILQCQDNC